MSRSTQLWGIVVALALAALAVFAGLAVLGSAEYGAQAVPKTDIDWAVISKLTVMQSADFTGACIDLDDDDDTSICADTDDQIDVEIGGVDTLVAKPFPTSTGTGATVTDNVLEIAGSSPAWITGTNTLNLLDLDLAVGDANTGTHAINGIMIDGITGDAQVTESAIQLGSGWDVGLDANGLKVDLDADADTSITADTDDQIDIEISGADDFQFTANAFTLAAGSGIRHATGTGEGVLFVAQIATSYDVTTTSSIVIPANANVVDWQFIVTTAYTDTGTDLMNCGTAADQDRYVDDLDLSSTGPNRGLDGNDMQADELANWGDVGSSNLTLQCVYTGQNGDAAVGAGVFTIWYVID